MTTTSRRAFIRKLSIFLAALLTRGCLPQPTRHEALTPTALPDPTSTATPTVAPEPTRPTATATPTVTPTLPLPRISPDPAWETVRECWYELNNPTLWDRNSDWPGNELHQKHTYALESLVGAGKLDAAIAEQIDLTFVEVIVHIYHGTRMVCYADPPREAPPRQNLYEQAALLEEMAVLADIAPSTVAQARAALERDIAWLAQWRGGVHNPGPLEEMEVDPISAEVARTLVAILLGL
jgi:hypothetical protein